MLVQLGSSRRVLRVWKEFIFEAAHWLPNVPEGHKCGKLHGHSYRVQLTVEGPVDDTLGWVLDYADIKKAFQGWYEIFDHKCLNDIGGLHNSTAENLAIFIADQMKPKLPGLVSVIVNETAGTGVEIRL
jgi:6-pyruvoyltetrahydropterin/6-carboxytetrahydropterin synthase